MFKYFTASRTHNYISIIDSMVKKYNGTYHHSIDCTPTEARNPENHQHVFNALYDKKLTQRERMRKTKPKPQKPIYKIGDRVRIDRKKGIFEKSYTQTFTEEIFQVTKVQTTDPITYKLSDLDGEEILGSFYKENLVKTSQEIYFIDHIIKRRVVNGVKEVLVSWVGYSDKYNSWIPQTNVIDTKKRAAVRRRINGDQ